VIACLLEFVVFESMCVGVCCCVSARVLDFVCVSLCVL